MCRGAIGGKITSDIGYETNETQFKPPGRSELFKYKKWSSEVQVSCIINSSGEMCGQAVEDTPPLYDMDQWPEYSRTIQPTVYLL